MPPSYKPSTRKPKTLGEAQELVATIHARVTGAEHARPEEAIGRCLAGDLVAPIDLPVVDVAAMDGYAVRASDLGPEGRAELRIVGEIAAGHPTERAVGPGEAMRIFTGAVIPPGTDRVVPQELCVRRGDRVSVEAPARAKPHIRLSGEDVLAGQTVLRAGTRLGPAQIALLAALRVETVQVLRPLRVALLSVGDELSEIGRRPGAGGIVDSNRPMFKACLEQLGCLVEDLGIIPDSPDILLRALIEAAARADLIISSGGASVGPADYLARLITRRGCLEFWKLNMRPGKPVGFGDIDDCPILALPGNPFAASVAFHLIGRVIIAQLSGNVSARPTSFRLPLASHVAKKPDHLQVLAGKLVRSNGTTAIEPLEMQGSANLLALAGAQGLILLPQGRENFPAGEIAEFVLL